MSSNNDNNNNPDRKLFFVRLFTGFFATFAGVSAALSAVIAYFINHSVTITPAQYIMGGIVTLIVYSVFFITALVVFNRKADKENIELSRTNIDDIKREATRQIESFKTSAQTSLTNTQTALDGDILQLENIAADLRNNQQRLLESLKKVEYDTVASIAVKNILGEHAVLELEGCVGCSNNDRHPRIYIQSSEFTLEKISLLDTIVWNLRKGCKYIYIIPNTSRTKQSYVDVVYGWYMKYAAFFISKNKFEEEERYLETKQEHKMYWNSIYMNYYQKAKKLWYDTSYTSEQKKEKRNKLLKKINEMFSSLIETHLDEESAFFITVALYQTYTNQGQHDRAIIKLPTIDAATNYLAYEIHADNESEFKLFENKFVKRFESERLIMNEDYSICGLFEPEITDEV